MGCDKSVVEKVLTGKEDLRPSENVYDWLGHGIYFWDSSPSRALQYAVFLKKNSDRARHPIKTPAVLGAVINPGFCLDLLDYQNLQQVKGNYSVLRERYLREGREIPENRRIGGSSDLLFRELDCAVIQAIHKYRSANGEALYDSVRGVFFEGDELYPNAGFRDKDHIQLCVCNPNCIKGYFLPRKENPRYARA